MSGLETGSIPRGFTACGVKAGIKPSGSLDLALLVSDRPCAAAGVYTTNLVYAAPVAWDRGLTPSTSVLGIVVNAGNANAATGDEGLAHARRTAQAAAKLLGGTTDDWLVASTGVIGQRLPIERLEAGLTDAVPHLTSELSGFDDASRAIMTTDTRPKVVSRRINIAGSEIRLLGLAKGAAMIGPKMATMLGFLLTDARVEPEALQSILRGAVERSFNCISVEGHMSTNDTVLLLANGAAGDALCGADLDAFAALVNDACIELARMIPDDGEGATHLVTIDVDGCRTFEDARAIARAVADSALVKTAIHGADPNWGRIVSAAGYAGVDYAPPGPALTLNGVELYRDGRPVPFDADAVARSIRERHETSIHLMFRDGSASVRFWTCDLTAEYVRLNADYTT